MNNRDKIAKFTETARQAKSKTSKASEEFYVAAIVSPFRPKNSNTGCAQSDFLFFHVDHPDGASEYHPVEVPDQDDECKATRAMTSLMNKLMLRASSVCCGTSAMFHFLINPRSTQRKRSQISLTCRRYFRDREPYSESVPTHGAEVLAAPVTCVRIQAYGESGFG